MLERPFRSPHNSASVVSLLGGGAMAMPGEISLAHNGVLYLDEVTQFSKMTLDLLRQPLEDGKIVISRARYRVEYPCEFMFVASMNPCPCGYYGDPTHKCKCSEREIAHYLSRVSGPLMDRIDMHVTLRGSRQNCSCQSRRRSPAAQLRPVLPVPGQYSSVGLPQRGFLPILQCRQTCSPDTASSR